MIVARCLKANQEHRKSARQYAHTFHIADRVCIADAFCELPPEFQTGILLHELGHLAMNDEGQPVHHSEKQADQLISILSGVKVCRRNYDRQKSLEWVHPRDLAKANRFIKKHLWFLP